MKPSFETAANPLATRWAHYQAIQQEMSMIRRDKLAAHCDLDACFMLHDEERGYLGQIFQQESARHINRLIVAHNHQGSMAVFPLPTTLAATQTRALLDRLYPASSAQQRAQIEDRQWLSAVTGLDQLAPVIEEESCPQRLNLFYVGDFLDRVDEAIGLARRIKTSVLLGDGLNTLEIMKRLRQVPDYSHHFPDHRPPPGKGKKRQAERPAALPSGGWQPVGF